MKIGSFWSTWSSVSYANNFLVHIAWPVLLREKQCKYESRNAVTLRHTVSVRSPFCLAKGKAEVRNKRGEQWLSRKKGRLIGKTGQGNKVWEDEKLDRDALCPHDEWKVGDRIMWVEGHINGPSLQDKTITPSSLPGEFL